MDWEVVAHFDNVVAAELAKNLLEEEGIAVTRIDDATIDNAWSRNSAQGGIKLCVRAEDLGRAELLLDHKSIPLKTDAEIETAIAERPEVAAKLALPPEPFEEFPSDKPLQRAFGCTVLGLLMPLFIPLHLYALYLLIGIRMRGEAVRSSNRWKVWSVLFLNAPLWAIIVVPTVFAFKTLADPTGHWRSTRFTGMDDHVLYVDFDPDFAHANTKDVPSPFGPLAVRTFSTRHGNRIFLINICTAERSPPDARIAIKDYVDRQFPAPGYRIESNEPTSINGFPATELKVAFTDRNGDAHFQHVKIALVDRHLIVLTADVPEKQREGNDVKRFFKSVELE